MGLRSGLFHPPLRVWLVRRPRQLFLLRVTSRVVFPRQRLPTPRVFCQTLPGLFRALRELELEPAVVAARPLEPRSPTPPACSPTPLPLCRPRPSLRRPPDCLRLLQRCLVCPQVRQFPASRRRLLLFPGFPPLVGSQAFLHRVPLFRVFPPVVGCRVFRPRVLRFRVVPPVAGCRVSPLRVPLCPAARPRFRL